MFDSNLVKKTFFTKQEGVFRIDFERGKITYATKPNSARIRPDQQKSFYTHIGSCRRLLTARHSGTHQTRSAQEFIHAYWQLPDGHDR
jgi:hypothetical protein